MNSFPPEHAIQSSQGTICRGYEPITGYKLEKLIGRGGFGEVWLSEAPGGLHKAVKFVFGATDEQRAVRELRSLERIKGVHHPFLLTLERFGIVDGRLVIVTELADGSLEDIYNRHLERGSCGIPRVALLSYLHDAADALDYLHSKYQLQHLDVKPGNLLLVGGHVKVGDFGLLKDLREAECSMVGGLTPVYAPPELFDGRPSLHSDQYSLAVMYQELLTGTRPFGGRTIAQLATQHVHSAPNLSPLPAADRPILARALEKDPTRRFSSCCEFIDALKSIGNRTAREATNDSLSARTDALTGTLRKDFIIQTPAIEDLPQLNLARTRGGVRITSHALVIALGGSGALVLHHLRDRVASHRGACPLDLHSVLIDTDPATIQAARLAEVSDRVPVCHSVHTSLKSPNEYRSYKGSKYKSISRRWLYNIPRSLSTEHMRPLGRLALVDHGDTVVNQLRESICHVSAVAGETTPDVYVVGSIDGGTGSGMILDIIHLTRHILDEFGMAQVPLMPIMLTGALHRDSQRALASADAAALMTEMGYFLKPGNGYPGDAAANWPSVPSARTPLVDAYLIAAGEPNHGFAEAIKTAFEYIWVNSSPANEFLAAARKDVGDDAIVAGKNSPKLRSIGIVRLRTPKLLEENLLAPSIVRQLLFKWLGDPAEAKELAPDLSARMIRRCGLSLDIVTKHCCGKLALERKVRLEQLQQFTAALSLETRNCPDLLEAALKSIAEKTLGDSGESLLRNGISALMRELSVRLSDTRCDLALAIESLNRLTTSMKQDAANARSGQIEHVSFIDSPGGDSNSLAAMAEGWLAKVICGRIADVNDQAAEILSSLSESICDRAAVLARCVQLISKRLDGNDDEVWQYVDEGIRNQLGSVLGTLRNKVSPSVVGMQSMIHQSEEVTSEALLQSLLDHSLPMIDAAMTWGNTDANVGTEQHQDSSAFNEAASPNSPSTRQEGGTPDAQGPTGLSVDPQNVNQIEHEQATEIRWDDPSIITEALRSVRPALLSCGGCRRLLLIVGSEPERARLEPRIRELHNGPLTSTVVPGAAAMLVCEAQQIRLSDVQSRMLAIAGSSEEVMSRLAARNDIDWTSRTSPNG